MDSQSLSFFQKTLIKAYYYLIIVDGMVDPKELSFGSHMIETEGIDRENFEILLDTLNDESPEKVKSSLIEDIQQLSKDEQVKIVAYMSNLADADGITDVSEKDIIHDLYHELHLDFKEITKARQYLKTN